MKPFRMTEKRRKILHEIITYVQVQYGELDNEDWKLVFSHPHRDVQQVLDDFDAYLIADHRTPNTAQARTA